MIHIAEQKSIAVISYDTLSFNAICIKLAFDRDLMGRGYGYGYGSLEQVMGY